MAEGTVTPLPPGTPSGTVTVAIPEEAPQLPLEVWRSIIGYHPYHFWQLADSQYVPVTSSCNTLVYESAWLSHEMAGRENIRDAIIEAEARLREHLDYSTGRRFIVETVQHPFPFVHQHKFQAHIGGRGRWLNIRLNEGHVRNLGVETYELIATMPTSITDEDGDGLLDTFTVSFNTTATDPDQLGIYFAENDRLDNDPVSERYRIAPVKVQIADNGVATIKGRAWLLVPPLSYQGVAKTKINPTQTASYASSVEIQRRYCDPTGTTTDTAQAVLVWETDPYPAWAAVCSAENPLSYSPHSTDPAAQAFAIARAQVRDARLGEITVGRAIYDADNDQWSGVSWGTCRQPDRIIVRYEAGAPLTAMEKTLNQIGVTGRWDAVVARFAAAELNRRICACDDANRELWRWQFDLARAAGANQEQYRISDADLSNPFGSRAGAVYAWRAVANLKLARAYLPG